MDLERIAEKYVQTIKAIVLSFHTAVVRQIKPRLIRDFIVYHSFFRLEMK